MRDAYDSLGGRGIIANGTLYMTTYGGNVYAYDLATGNLEWQYDTPSGGFESPYAYYSLWVFMEDTVADGKLFVPEGHMYSPPLYHGCQQLALNITNGQVVWSIDAFDIDNAPAISDGIMTDLNAMTTRYTPMEWDQPKQPLPHRRWRNNCHTNNNNGYSNGHLSWFTTRCSGSELPKWSSMCF